MSDEKTLQVYDNGASDYATNFCMSMEPDTQLSAFMEMLPDIGHVLDLGCGPGRSAAIMAAAGHDVLATDASREMVALASKQAGVTARQETFDEIAGDRIYDGVWANFSLLHAERDDLPRHLDAISTAIKPGGCFHIGMKTGDSTKRDSLGRRYTYVTEAELDGLLRAAGFEPVRQWTGEDMGFDGTMAPWVVKQARKT